MDRIPIASDSTFNAARDAALTAFIASEPEARTLREAAAAKATHKDRAAEARINGHTELYLLHVPEYLAELEGRPDGYDFEGERSKYTERVK